MAVGAASFFGRHNLANAAFVALAHNEFPALLDRLAELESLLGEVVDTAELGSNDNYQLDTELFDALRDTLGMGERA